MLNSLPVDRRAQLACQLSADDRGAIGERFELGKGGFARDIFHAAIGGRDQPLGRQVLESGADAAGDSLGCLRRGVTHAYDAKDHGLVAEPVESGEIEVGLGGFERDLLNL